MVVRDNGSDPCYSERALAQEPMTMISEPEIDSCSFLFLRKIEELDGNGLRLVVEEGQASPIPGTLEIGGTVITDCHPVTSTHQSKMFEIVWDRYIAYSVRNESFVPFDESEIADGGRFRHYSKSHFLDFIRAATFATNDYPGPMHHIGINCEDHIIDVVSTNAPQVKRVRPTQLST